MPDYDLSGLSTRSFEKLIQALVGRVLGSGTITFGDGPDGGREATFEGKMDYPSEADPWDGYCVVQAKFRQRPKGAKSDSGWALKELEGELKDFADPKKRRRCPDYYLFATNVVLTPVSDSGGKDQAAALFRKYRKKVPLRDWAIWDGDEIARFLDTYEGIRRAYAAWITPGDVLAEVMQQLASKKRDFLEVMTNFLAKELRCDQCANLEQAGHTAEERIALARVFVDLPTTTQRTAEPPAEDGKGKPPVTELVASLIERAQDRLDPASSLRSRFSPEEKTARPEGPQPGRYVLVGGPGQGKTTVGQFACQLFRAALLRDRPPHLLAPEVHDILSAIEEQCQSGKLELPRSRRFPVRIALSDFAAALNVDRDLSLLAYVARQIERRASQSISPEDLRQWLSAYPWLLVLDGLDEVPPSTNREDVLRRVEEFWIDAAQANADVLVLATTRPQGYNDDFSPTYYRHLWLAPLSVKRALAYAERLVGVRYAGEGERQQKILTRLREASKEEATARLMRSPLQVTIMATLVDQIGTPPQDRWRLFDEYYGVICNRERERPIPAAELLRDHKANIDAIHHQVGLVLQVESERAGGTEARLTAERFGAVVTARLEDEGYAGDRLAQLRDRIIDAAANRLVFLVGLEAGQVGFEIRSLQEYMAAEAVMTGNQASVQERLRRLAPIATWRNVFLFAAGRCFVRDQHLRDTIHTVCVELNDDLAGQVARATLAGSVLALDLLEDGVARRQPKYARLLARCAARLIELPPAEIHGRLADVSEDDVDAVLREELEKKLAVPGLDNLAAWAILLPLVGRGSPWAYDLAERLWPLHAQQPDILTLPTADKAAAWVDNRVTAVIKVNPPTRTQHLMGRHRPSGRSWPFTELFDSSGQLKSAGIDLDAPELSGGFFVSSIQEVNLLDIDLRLVERDAHPGWLSLFEYVRFAHDPSNMALAQGLARVAKDEDAFQFRVWGGSISWVFGSCMACSRTPDELAALADRAARGDLGDLPDWLAAERRWQERGLTLDDFLYLTEERWPFDRHIAERGFPLAGAGETYKIRGVDPETILKFLINLHEMPRVQGKLTWFFFLALDDFPDGCPSLSAELLVQLVRLDEDQWFPLRVALAISRWVMDDPSWLDCLNQIGMTRWSVVNRSGLDFQPLVTLFAANPDRVGLLPLMAAAIDSKEAPDLSSAPAVRYENYDDPKIRWAAIVLELAQGNLRRHRATELAAETFQLCTQNERSLDEILPAIVRYERFDAATDHYLLELRRQLPGAGWHDNAGLIDALNDSLRRRRSGVADPSVWRSLALPPKLLDVFATPTHPPASAP